MSSIEKDYVSYKVSIDIHIDYLIFLRQIEQSISLGARPSSFVYGVKFNGNKIWLRELYVECFVCYTEIEQLET